MILKLTNFQLFANLIWASLFGLSTFLFCCSAYFLPSSVLYCLTLFMLLVGCIYTNSNKHFYFFNPLLLVIYNAFFYISMQGLFFFSKFNNIPLFTIPTQNETVLAEICLIYVAFVISILLPYLCSIFTQRKFQLNLKFFKRSFDTNTLGWYLIISQIVLIILLAAMFIVTGFTPYSALMNGLLFRLAYGHGLAGYIFTVFYSLISLNSIIVLKYLFINKKKTILLTLLSYFYIGFYLFWFLVSGGRGALLAIVITAIFVYASKKNIKINLFKIVLAILVMILTLVILAFYHIYRTMAYDAATTGIVDNQHAGIIQTTLERADAFAIGVIYFNDVKNKYDNFIAYPEIKIGQQLFYQFATIIPRKIMPDKGISVHAELTKQLYPQVFNNDVGFIFGGVVDLFFAGGLFFLLFDAFIFGIIMLFLQKNYQKVMDYDFFLVNYINIYISYVGVYFSMGLLNTDMSTKFPLRIIVSILITWFLTKKIHFKSGGN